MNGSFELSYVLEGRAQYHQASGTRIVQPGTLILFNPYEQYSCAALDGKPVVVLTVHIHRLFARHYVDSIPKLKFNSQQISDLSSDEYDALVKLLFQLAIAYLGDSDSQQFDVVGYAILLMGKLFSSLEWEIEEQPDSIDVELQNGRAKRLISYIDENCCQKITLSMLAEMEGITPNSLSHFFRKAFGVSFQNYLKAQRFERALVLMRDKSMSKTDICIYCGFSESGYLEAACQKTFGCSVAEYRSLCEKMEEDNLLSIDGPLYKKCGRKESVEILKKFFEEKCV